MHYIQGNIIFHFIYAIFDKKLFLKCTDFYIKEHKLYNNLLDKISSETELSMPSSSGEDGLTPVLIPHISIPPIQNNSPTHSSSPFLLYKSLSSILIPGSKKSMIEIEENDNINSDIEMQPLSPQ